mmetsp:Transcript_25507/g.55106  ORF Transcript_25507/g.55106 Transcript_25507/m.55106 type:complete len:493 (+) Transcript_25507:556-2034(+)
MSDTVPTVTPTENALAVLNAPDMVVAGVPAAVGGSSERGELDLLFIFSIVTTRGVVAALFVVTDGVAVVAGGSLGRAVVGPVFINSTEAILVAATELFILGFLTSVPFFGTLYSLMYSKASGRMDSLCGFFLSSLPPFAPLADPIFGSCVRVGFVEATLIAEGGGIILGSCIDASFVGTAMDGSTSFGIRFSNITGSIVASCVRVGFAAVTLFAAGGAVVDSCTEAFSLNTSAGGSTTSLGMRFSSITLISGGGSNGDSSFFRGGLLSVTTRGSFNGMRFGLTFLVLSSTTVGSDVDARSIFFLFCGPSYSTYKSGSFDGTRFGLLVLVLSVITTWGSFDGTGFGLLELALSVITTWGSFNGTLFGLLFLVLSATTTGSGAAFRRIFFLFCGPSYCTYTSLFPPGSICSTFFEDITPAPPTLSLKPDAPRSKSRGGTIGGCGVIIVPPLVVPRLNSFGGMVGGCGVTIVTPLVASVEAAEAVTASAAKAAVD